MQLDYKPPGPIAKAFMKDEAFVRGIRGPVGSGKSVTCCMEIMRRAVNQKPNDSGIRRSRWAVIRNTNPQLKTTTIKTWRDWFSDEIGKFVWSPPYRILSISLWGIRLPLSLKSSSWLWINRKM